MSNTLEFKETCTVISTQSIYNNNRRFKLFASKHYLVELGNTETQMKCDIFNMCGLTKETIFIDRFIPKQLIYSNIGYGFIIDDLLFFSYNIFSGKGSFDITIKVNLLTKEWIRTDLPNLFSIHAVSINNYLYCITNNGYLKGIKYNKCMKINLSDFTDYVEIPIEFVDKDRKYLVNGVFNIDGKIIFSMRWNLPWCKGEDTRMIQICIDEDNNIVSEITSKYPDEYHPHMVIYEEKDIDYDITGKRYYYIINSYGDKYEFDKDNIIFKSPYNPRKYFILNNGIIIWTYNINDIGTYSYTKYEYNTISKQKNARIKA